MPISMLKRRFTVGITVRRETSVDLIRLCGGISIRCLGMGLDCSACDVTICCVLQLYESVHHVNETVTLGQHLPYVAP